MIQTLAEWLAQTYPASTRQTLRKMVADGRVSINGTPARRFKDPVGAKDRVTVQIRPSRASGILPKGQPSKKPDSAPPRSLDVRYEDTDVLVVFKPVGLLTSTVPREKRPTLLAMVRRYLERPGSPAITGLIHRLDRDASGLLIFSKNDEAYVSLKSQFFYHSVGRTYHAEVRGSLRPPTGRISSRLVERKDGKVFSTRIAGKGESAITDYKTLHVLGKRSLVRLALKTGRKHQIRVHLSQSGCPIVGDTVYGPPIQPGDETQLMLIATSLSFDHPRTGKRMLVELPLPPAMAKFLKPPK